MDSAAFRPHAPEGSAYVYTIAAGPPGKQPESRRVVVSRVRLAPVDRPYFVLVSRSLTPLLGELKADRYILLAVVPGGILLAGMAGWFLARKSLAPVLAMSEKAYRIGVENLEERLPVLNPRDELGRLAATFNDLLSRLAAAFGSHRRFMADASHELRTPISVVRTTASVTLARSGRGEGEYRDALTVVEAQARRLSRMVEDMLNLARADSGHFSVNPRPFHLDEMLLETVEAASVLARERETRIELGDLPKAPFLGDEDLLRQMVLNLLDNALKHTPGRGRVEVLLEAGPESWLIRVADSGPGIPEAAKPHIFSRFYRVDKSNARAEATIAPGLQSSGAGLGLAIARWIAEIHDGALVLEKSDSSGSVFLATLPSRHDSPADPAPFI